MNKARTPLAALAGLSLAGTLGGCSAGMTEPPAAVDTSAEYADGSYEAEGQYQTPGGTETVGVEVTLENDVVTAVSVTPQGESPNAKRFQGEFAAGIGEVAVGKDIDTLDVDRVAGSSLTSRGFNDAIEKIKANAVE